MRGLATQVPVFSSAASHGWRYCEGGRWKEGGVIECKTQSEPRMLDRLVQLSPKTGSSAGRREELKFGSKDSTGQRSPNRRASTALSDFSFFLLQ